ncbi:MAG TPA: YggU family protein [Sedimenticola sp.]|nr:YggU family protein [Sedimenticola sp.]
MQAGDWFRWEDGDLLLRLRVQPRASRDEFVGPHGDHFKVRITAPPLDGRANAHLVRFLARAFGVGRSQVILESGESARNKCFRIKAPKKLPVPAGPMFA